ncbi:MAG: hypothetical protein JNJ78_23470 [Anaerolineae bacterium]|nr:hypothetical protein [Anaerolineae bacterium]
MKNLKWLVFFILIALPLMPLSAQDSTCELDLDEVRTLLAQAEALASDNDPQQARRALRDAAQALEAQAANCSGGAELTQTLSLDVEVDDKNVTFTFAYPDGWLTGETESSFPNALIASSESALGKPLDGSEPPSLISGEAIMAVGLMDAGSMFADPDLGPSPTPESLLISLISSAGSEFGSPSEVTNLTLSDQETAWLTFSGRSGFNMLILLMETPITSDAGDQQYVLMMLLTAPGELQELIPTVEAMAASVKLEAQ